MPSALKVHELHLKSFLAHEDTTLDLRVGRIVWLVGAYGCGKTSVRDAVEYLLTGSARGLYRKDSEDLIYDPAVLGLPREEKPRRMAVEGIVSFGEKAVEMGRSKTRSTHTQAQIESMLGVPDLDVVKAVLDAQRFIHLDNESRLRLIDRVLGAPITAGELAAAGIDDEEVQADALKSIKTAKNRATEKRRAAQTALEGAGGSGAPEDETIEGMNLKLSEMDPAGLQAKIAGAVKKRDELFAEVEQQKGIAQGGIEAKEAAVGTAENDVAAAEAEVEKAKKALADLEKSAAAKTATAAHKNLKLLRDGSAGDRRLLEEGKAAVTIRDQAVKAAEAEYRKAAALKDGPCPTCGKVMKAAERMKALEADVKAAQDLLAEAKGNVENLSKAVASDDKKEAELQKVIDAFKRDHASASAAVGRANDDLRDVQDALAAAKTDLADAKAAAVDPKVLEERIAEVAKSDTRIERARALHVRLLGYREAVRLHAEAGAQAEKHRLDVERFRKMETALSDEGILATRSAPGLKALQEKVAALSAKACPPGASVTVDGQAGVLFNGVSVTRSSDGQQWVAGAIVAAALSSLSGLGFLFLDKMADIDVEGRDRIFGILNALTQGEKPELAQVFMVTLRDRTGWCDRCQEFRARMSPYFCRDCKRRDPPEEHPVGMFRPKGKMVGHLRIFEFSAPGKVAEVLPAEKVAS